MEAAQAIKSFDVMLPDNGKEIHLDTVFYGARVSIDPKEIKDSLVNHDGYNPNIIVRENKGDK